MADVKWIKITTDIFDDEKILMIESLPSADSIIVVWFKLLTFAGKQNNEGVFIMNNRIAYTDEMLASIFRRDINTIRMALKTFQNFGMIDIIDDVITIPNWNKHQTLDAYERKKERDRIYQAERRANQRKLIEKSSDTSSDCKNVSNATQSSDVAISDKEIEIEKEIDIDKDIYTGPDEPDTLDGCMNPPECPTDEPESSVNNTKKPGKRSKQKKEKPVKHKYGEWKNVLLTDDELLKLKTKFPDWGQWIERLSGYIASTGKRYKSHYATILVWARRDIGEGRKSPGNRQNGAYTANIKTGSAEDLNNFYKMAGAWAAEEGEQEPCMN